MIAIHKKYKILSRGSLKFLWNDYQGLCYGRFSHTEQMIVILNNRDEAREVMIELWPAGISRLEDTPLLMLLQSEQNGYSEEQKLVIARAGAIRLLLPQRSVTLLYHKDQ